MVFQGHAATAGHPPWAGIFGRYAELGHLDRWKNSQIYARSSKIVPRDAAKLGWVLLDEAEESAGRSRYAAPWRGSPPFTKRIL